MLILCTECSRHVRVGELRCPFCDALVTAVARARGPHRLGRAARMAAITLTVSCGGTTTSATDAAPKDATAETLADAANADSGAAVDTAFFDEDAIAKPYGAPPADGLLV